MTDVLLITATFLFAGTVKGVIGLGLPAVSLGLLTASFGLEAAMALMLAPSFVTNAWQAVAGGHLLFVLRRTRLFLVLAIIAVWPGVAFGSVWESESLASLLGCLLILYGLSGLASRRAPMSTAQKPCLALLAGAANGVLAGLTGSFVVPGVPYLQSLSLSRDQLVQAMGVLFTCSTVVLAAALAAEGRLPRQAGFASALAVVPALFGMAVGKTVRAHLSESAFRRIFFASLILLGAYILIP